MPRSHLFSHWHTDINIFYYIDLVFLEFILMGRKAWMHARFPAFEVVDLQRFILSPVISWRNLFLSLCYPRTGWNCSMIPCLPCGIDFGDFYCLPCALELSMAPRLGRVYCFVFCLDLLWLGFVLCCILSFGTQALCIVLSNTLERVKGLSFALPLQSPFSLFFQAVWCSDFVACICFQHVMKYP